MNYKPAKEVAKDIRKELKKHFPGTKFSVRSSHISITIHWDNFPTVKAVEEVVKKYEQVNRCEITGEYLSGGNLFINCSNDWTPEVEAEITEMIPEGINKGDYEWWSWFNTCANELYEKKYKEVVTAKPKKKTTKKAEEQETKEETATEEVNPYESKKQQRIQKYLELAKKNEEKAQQLFNSPAIEAVRDMMGEPIKVGHHSERRHRKLHEKADRDMVKAIEAFNKAEYYRQKAEAVKKNQAISSDDPEAIRKYEEKLAKLEELHEYMKYINEEYERCKGDIDKMNIKESTKEALKTAKANHPYSWPFKPFESYAFSNNRAEIRRIKQRIEELKQRAQDKTTEIQVADGVKIVDNVEINRVQVVFDHIPSEEIRRKLSKRGFRWSPRNKAWQRHRSNSAMYWAKQIVSGYEKK